MRVMMMVKATRGSEEGQMPETMRQMVKMDVEKLKQAYEG